MRFASIIVLAFATVTASNAIQAKIYVGAQEAKWKQIVILQSTRNDVEKQFGKSKYDGPIISYDLEEGHLVIKYSGFNFCEHGKNFGWNTSEWTVIGITFSPNPMPQFSSLNLNIKRFRKVRENPCCPDLITFIDDEEGVAYTVNPEGTLNTIEYFPSSKYNYLRCNKQPK